MKKLVCFIMALVMGLLFTSCGKADADDLKTIKDKGVLTVGITVYEPMDYLAEDGTTWIGFDADLANEFGKKLGVNVKFQIIEWDNKVMELKGSQIDMIWNGMTASDDLAKEIDLSLNYSNNYQCVVVKTENVAAYTNADSLKCKQVAVEAGSAGDSAVADLVEPNKVTAQIDALNEVIAGTSDACVIDYTMAVNVVGKGQYAGLTIIEKNLISFDEEVFAVGLRKNSNLTKELNDFFKEVYASGLMARLAEKYQVSVNEAAFN